MGESVETPPAPAEVLDDGRIQYQAMTDLSTDEYQRLANDIRENGVLQPVVVDDSPEQVIIDGHHREAVAQHYDLDESKQPAYVVVGGLNTEEKLSRAIKQNLIGRDTTEGVKSHAVKQYLELSWDRTDGGDLIRPETDTEVAEKLGVSEQTVGRVVNNFHVEIIYHDRVVARRYYEDNPDASYREVARQVDASQPTVTGWLKEDFDEGDDSDTDDEQPTLTATVTDANEAEKAGEVFDRATNEEDEDIRDEAQANAERLARGDTSPTAAKENVEEVGAEKESEKADGGSDIEPFTSQQTDEWSSPREIVEPLDDAVGGFDLDPCSGAEQSPFAAATYTESDDGLTQPWHGTVWVNPPYSGVSDWVDKATAAVNSGNAEQVVFLCKGDSSTDWWQQAAQAASVICAIDHRLSFGDGENSAPFASHILVFGEVTESLAAALTDHGTLLTQRNQL